MEKRLFIGIKIEPSLDLIHLMNKLIVDLKDSDIKWVDTNNLHITLMFLGEVSVKKIPEISSKLKKVAQEINSFEVEIMGLGKFEKNHKTNIIWTGIEDNGFIEKLANEVIQEMVYLDFESETRKFKPHLTLGRVKAKCKEERLNNLILEFKDKRIQNVYVEDIILFESVLKPTGPIYNSIEYFPLMKENL